MAGSLQYFREVVTLGGSLLLVGRYSLGVITLGDHNSCGVITLGRLLLWGVITLGRSLLLGGHYSRRLLLGGRYSGGSLLLVGRYTWGVITLGVTLWYFRQALLSDGSLVTFGRSLVITLGGGRYYW